MIKIKTKIKLPKLTPDQKALKKCITPYARDLKNRIKSEVPKLSGALQFSIDFKVYSIKGNAKAIIGVKSQYTRVVKGKTKLPNLYAIKAGVKLILKRYINPAAVQKLTDAVKELKGGVLAT